MPVSQQQLDIAATALRNYVASIDGWLEAGFVPWTTYEQGAQIIINHWNGYLPAVVPADRLKGCGQLLYDDIAAEGYGDRVTVAQCTDGAAAVLAAAGLIKSRQT